ncbi:PAS domain-containing sensor histidine kinase [Candidatus Saccharibacteria bacterium]|nr:PAS domain-containing sensor histidine kinase [Candidatus Saccharibacteria bacterium]
MAKVGKVTNPRLNTQLLHTIRFAGLFIAILITAYSVFLYFSRVQSPSPLYSDGSMLFSTLAFMLLAIAQAIFRPSDRRSLAVYLALYYLTATLYAVFVMGDAPAVYIFGIILIITTEIVLGSRAMVVAVIYCATAMIAFGLLYPDDTGGHLASIVISAIMMSGTVAVLLWMNSSNLVRLEIYQDLKIREELQSKSLETVINSLNDAVLGVDTDTGIIHLYNAAVLNLLDTNKDITDLRVDSLFKLTNEDGETVRLAELIRTPNKFIERGDLIHTYNNGQKINLYISISPIRDVFTDLDVAGMRGVIIIARDITKQKSLDDERDEFIAVVSHELRTPVAIAEGALSNIQFLIQKGGDVKLLEQTLGNAHQQVLFLSQMVNDLSALSRAQRGVNMQPENIDIKIFLSGLRDKYIANAKKQRLKLALDVRVSGEIRTPRMAIEEVMQNLIINAIKYTRVGSVTIGARRLDGGLGGPEVELFVRDTGIGISKSDQAHIFGRFWRSEDYRTRETSGTGLGLHVVQQLTSKMNTRILLRSRLNHGSIFSFRLPLLPYSTTKNQPRNKSDN